MKHTLKFVYLLLNFIKHSAINYFKILRILFAQNLLTHCIFSICFLVCYQMRKRFQRLQTKLKEWKKDEFIFETVFLHMNFLLDVSGAIIIYCRKNGSQSEDLPRVKFVFVGWKLKMQRKKLLKNKELPIGAWHTKQSISKSHLDTF